MYWNHRFCKQTRHYTVGDKTYKSVDFGIHEVHYNSNDEIVCITKEPVAIVSCDDCDEYSDLEMAGQVHEIIDRMLKAMDKPLIDMDTIVYAEPTDDE